MERTILASEFKGGIWHKYFATGNKKDETLSLIINEKIRFYKLYYPFLEKKQIFGKVYEELGIPHICGDVNKKELYKMFLQQRKKKVIITKNSRKTKDKSQKYEPLLIEKKSRSKNSYKKPTFIDNLIVKQNQVKVNNTLKKNVEKSKNDIAFDKLLFVSTDTNNETQEMSKHPKSVRFNDGIEVHRVSPAQPLYKLKRVGRLFDEPSSVRTEPNHCQHNEEDFFDSDSEFDADTGIISDAEDYDLNDSPPRAKVNQGQEIKAKKDIEKRSIYDCSEDEFGSTESETAKEGNSLILSSKMITAAQGKWVRGAERVVGNNEKNQISEEHNTINNDKGVNKVHKIVRAEIETEENVSIDESILERIKFLHISSLTEQEGITNLDMTGNANELIKEKLITKTPSTENKQVIDNKEVTLKNPSDICYEIVINKNNKNSKISLENIINESVNKYELITADVNKLSYSEIIFDAKSHTELNLEKGFRNKPNMLLTENSDFIDDWNSSNNSISNKNLSDVNANNILLLESSTDYVSCPDGVNEIKKHSNILSSIRKSEAMPITEEEADNVKEEFNEQNFSLDEESNSNIKERDSYLSVVNIDYSEQASPLPSDPLEYEQTVENAKPNISLNNLTYETKLNNVIQHFQSESKDSRPDEECNPSRDLLNSETSFVIKSATLGQRELEVNYISPRSFRGVVNQQNRDLNKICSTIYSLLTKPIMMQSPELRAENNKYDKIISKEAELLKDQVKRKTTKNIFSEYFPNKPTQETVSTTDLINSSEPYNEELDTASLKNEMKKIYDSETGKKTFIDKSQSYNDRVNDSQKLKKDLQNKLSNVTQSLKTAIITMEQLNYPNTSTAVKLQDTNEEDCFEAFNTSQKLYQDKTENDVNESEATDLYQGLIAVETEPSSMNFLAKVQMWSMYSENFIKNLKVSSQSTSSIIASCNTDLSQRATVEVDGNQSLNNENSGYENSLDLEDSKSLILFDHEKSSICESMSEEWISKSNDEKNHETESSIGTVTPVKNQQNKDGDEVSTAYETDPETGKLKMNRYLKPVSSSTPDEKYKEILNQELLQKSRSDCEELLVHKYLKNKRNKDSYSGIRYEDLNTEAERKNEDLIHNNFASEYLSISQNIISESNATKNTESSVAIMENEKQDEFNKTDTKSVINCRDLNTFSKFENIKHPKNVVISNSCVHSTELSAVDYVNSSESIIGNSDPNYIEKYNKILRNEKSIFNIECSAIGTNKQNDQLNNTVSSSKHTDNTTSIVNVETYSNKVSITESRDLNKINKRPIQKVSSTDESATDNQLYFNKTGIESMIPDSDLTKTCEFTNVKHPKAVLANNEYSINNKQDECNKYSSKSIIEKSNPNTCGELTRKYKKNLTATTELMINSRQDTLPEICNDNKFKKKVCTDKVTIEREKYVPSELPGSNHFRISLDCNHISKMGNSELTDHTIKPNTEMVESKHKSPFKKSHVTFLIRNETLQEFHDCNNTEIKSQHAMKLSPDGHVSLQRKSQNNQDSKLKGNKTIWASKSDETHMHESEIINNSGSSANLELQDFKNLVLSNRIAAGLPVNVQESQVIPSESPKISLSKDFITRNPMSGLKRKLKTFYEISNGLDSSPLSEEEDVEMICMVKTTDHHSDGSVETDASSMKINRKKLNTDIRKKRAKLIKENPVKKGSTSSSEDDAKISLPMKRKILELKTLSAESSSEQRTIKQSKVFVAENQRNVVNGRSTQREERESNSIQDEEMERNFLSLTLSSENEVNYISDLKTSDKSNIYKNKIKKHEETNLKTSINSILSKTTNKPSTSATFKPNIGDDSLKTDLFNNSKSIFELDSNADRESHNKIYTINSSLLSNIEKSKSNKTSLTDRGNSSSHVEIQGDDTKNTVMPELSPTNTWTKKIKHLKEKAQTISRKFTSPRQKIGKKSHKSFPLCKGQEGGKNKENVRLSLRNSRNSNPQIKGTECKNSRPLLKKLNSGSTNIELDDDRKNKFKSEDTKKKNLLNKNVKSSVVCWVGTNETSQIDNSPEVNTLLRRTYFMGNNH